MPTILFAGGGTGGHLFPALAIADALAETVPETRCRFICSDRPIDAQILTRAGVDHFPSRARPFSLRPQALGAFLAHWGPSVREARALIRGGKGVGRASVLIAMGGFVAAPAVQGARVSRTHVVLVNLDAVPGKANRWCARHAGTVLTAAEGAAVPAGWRRIGPIVRPEARAARPATEARASFDLDPNRPTLLVTGGSQGARSINQLMAAFIEAEPGTLAPWQVLHQTGGEAAEAETLQLLYDRAGIRARVLPFIDRVGDAWAAADCCVARAGAGTVAEAWANRVPCLFLPYPYHRDEHQRHNAAPLVQTGGGLLAHDAIDPARNLETVGPVLRELILHDQKRRAMRAALDALGPADGAETVARVVSDLVYAGTAVSSRA